LFDPSCKKTRRFNFRTSQKNKNFPENLLGLTLMRKKNQEGLISELLKKIRASQKTFLVWH
jgi:hypothetical protein